MYAVELEWEDMNGVSQSSTKRFVSHAQMMAYVARVCFREDVTITIWKEENDG